MTLAEKSLQQVILDTNIAGKDGQHIKMIISSIAEALNVFHQCGWVHGDLKPNNIVRSDNRYKLIDFDASAFIQSGYAGLKYSSAYIAPEMIYRSRDGSYDIRVFDLSKKAEYDFIRADPSQDAWALGMIAYYLITGRHFFHVNAYDNIDGDDFKQLYDFDDSMKDAALAKITDPLGRNLVDQLLQKDPKKRARMDFVTLHPYLTNKMAPRLIGDPAEFDVFISYRVDSDAGHASMIYEILTASGMKVWWDKLCLESGKDWEEGFCNGLMKSCIFLPILSREAINSSTKPKCCFANLKKDSRCDNVLLEHKLALDLSERGLIEFIFPVMIGDLNSNSEHGEPSYGNYFANGCHPNTQPSDDDCTIDAVTVKLCEHLDRMSLGSMRVEDFTWKNSLNQITKRQGFFVEGKKSKAFQGIVGPIKSMLAMKKV